MNSVGSHSPPNDQRLFKLLAVGQALLIAVTWPLWTPQTAFPQVPLVHAAGYCPQGLEWTLLAALSASQGIIFVTRKSLLQRLGCILAVLSQSLLIVIDQHRLQPWAWEFILVSLILATANSSTAAQAWRCLVIGIYTWSAWSKIDYGFCLQHGPFLLNGLCKALQLRHGTEAWPEAVRLSIAGAIPIFELLIAAGLSWTRTRRFALWGAGVMHIALLLALGPLGHNHQPGVLCWNLFFLVQNWLLFSATSEDDVSTTTSGDLESIEELESKPRRSLSHCGNLVAQSIVIAAVIWPTTESLGFCDHWPAWSVYAARIERITLRIDNDELSKIPAHLQRYLVKDPQFERLPVVGEWSSFRIDRWSLDAVRAPIYPQNRFQIGVAIAIIDEFDLQQPLIVVEGQADRVTAQRTVSRYASPQSIKKLARTYRLNALPRSRN